MPRLPGLRAQKHVKASGLYDNEIPDWVTVLINVAINVSEYFFLGFFRAASWQRLKTRGPRAQTAYVHAARLGMRLRSGASCQRTSAKSSYNAGSAPPR